MDLKDAFKELDNLYEDSDYLDRQSLISNIKAMGFNYNFNRFTTEQLACILTGLLAKTKKRNKAEKIIANPVKYCMSCNAILSDSGICSKCSDSGLGDIYDGIINN